MNFNPRVLVNTIIIKSPIADKSVPVAHTKYLKTKERQKLKFILIIFRNVLLCFVRVKQ